MNKIWSLFESYYPNGNFKSLFTKANEEKVKLLQQDTSVAMNMTCHKMLDKSSFVVKKKKKAEVPKANKPSSSGAQQKQLKLTEMAAKKNKVPKASSGLKEPAIVLGSDSSTSAESSDQSSDEDIDEKLRNFIQSGFFL